MSKVEIPDRCSFRVCLNKVHQGISDLVQLSCQFYKASMKPQILGNQLRVVRPCNRINIKPWGVGRMSVLAR